MRKHREGDICVFSSPPWHLKYPLLVLFFPFLHISKFTKKSWQLVEESWGLFLRISNVFFVRTGMEDFESTSTNLNRNPSLELMECLQPWLYGDWSYWIQGESYSFLSVFDDWIRNTWHKHTPLYSKYQICMKSAWNIKHKLLQKKLSIEIETCWKLGQTWYIGPSRNQAPKASLFRSEYQISGG